MAYRYFVQIQGHEPPFKYQLKRELPNGKIEGLGSGGEVNHFQEAVDIATAAAERYEWDRKHRETIDCVTVLQVKDEPAPLSPVGDEKVAELEQALENTTQQ